MPQVDLLAKPWKGLIRRVLEGVFWGRVVDESVGLPGFGSDRLCSRRAAHLVLCPVRRSLSAGIQTDRPQPFFLKR